MQKKKGRETEYVTRNNQPNTIEDSKEEMRNRKTIRHTENE